METFDILMGLAALSMAVYAVFLGTMINDHLADRRARRRRRRARITRSSGRPVVKWQTDRTPADIIWN